MEENEKGRWSVILPLRMDQMHFWFNNTYTDLILKLAPIVAGVRGEN